MTRTTIPQSLILGGGYAGLMAAARIGSRAAVTLVDARPEFSQRIRFHELLAGRPKTLDFARWLGRRGARFVQARVDPGARAAARHGPDARRESDRAGLRHPDPRPGERHGGRGSGVAENAVRLDDPAAIRRTRRGSGPRRLRRPGAGGRRRAHGIETATELAERYPGLRVTLATRGRVGEGYSRPERSTCGGVCGSGRVAPGRRRHPGPGAGPRLAGGRGAIDFDLCVWAGGFAGSSLAREAGLTVDRCGRALVDPALRAAGHPEIFVAGDSAVADLPDGRASAWAA